MASSPSSTKAEMQIGNPAVEIDPTTGLLKDQRGFVATSPTAKPLTDNKVTTLKNGDISSDHDKDKPAISANNNDVSIAGTPNPDPSMIPEPNDDKGDKDKNNSQDHYREFQENIRKDGYLDQHEGGDYQGHTQGKHVGKTHNEMMEMVDRSASKGVEEFEISTFPDQKTAEQSMRRSIIENDKAIQQWYKNPNSDATQEFDFDTGRVIGSGIKKTGEAIVYDKRTIARVVLKKTKDGAIKILTGYPV